MIALITHRNENFFPDVVPRLHSNCWLIATGAEAAWVNRNYWSVLAPSFTHWLSVDELRLAHTPFNLSANALISSLTSMSMFTVMCLSGAYAPNTLNTSCAARI